MIRSHNSSQVMKSSMQQAVGDSSPEQTQQGCPTASPEFREEDDAISKLTTRISKLKVHK